MNKCPAMYSKITDLLKKLVKILAQPVIATIFGLVVGAVVILLAKQNPLHVYREMFQKSFFGGYYLLQTLTRSVPVIACSLSVVFAWRAGYINLGAEGQMIAGGFIGAIVAIYMPGPSWLVFIVAVLAALVAGMLLAMFSAFIYDRFKVSIVISTLMMNYAVNYICSYFVTYPLRDPASELALQSKMVPEGMRFLRFVHGQTFNLGFFIAILLVVLVSFIIYKTTFGYESKITGLNPVFAAFGGIRKGKVMYVTMAMSGMLAAAAGLLEVFGVKYRYMDGMFTSTSYAWTGLMAGLIASLNAVGSFFVSIFLSGIQVGGTAVQRTTNIPYQVATLIQSTITLFVSVKIVALFVKKKKRNLMGGTVPGDPESAEDMENISESADAALPVEAPESVELAKTENVVDVSAAADLKEGGD